MRSFVVACAAVCGVSVSILLLHTSAIIYIEKYVPVRNFPAVANATQLIGTVVAVDIPKRLITLRIMSPYTASESYLAVFSYDETTAFRLVNEYATLGTPGISNGQFPAGLRVEATVARAPGSLHMNALFGSMAL